MNFGDGHEYDPIFLANMLVKMQPTLGELFGYILTDALAQSNMFIRYISFILFSNVEPRINE